MNGLIWLVGGSMLFTGACLGWHARKLKETISSCFTSTVQQPRQGEMG